MNRKISMGAALAMALLMVAASIPLTMLYAQRQQNKLVPNLPALIERFRALNEVRLQVTDNFLYRIYDDKVDTEMVRGYIAGLGDSQSKYLDSKEYQTYMDRQQGKASELGLSMQYDPNVKGLVINQIKQGSTAAVSDLQIGDQITKAEAGGTVLFNRIEIPQDQSLAALDEFNKAIADSAETASITITLTYKRNGKTQPVNVMLGNALSSISNQMMDSYTEPGETPIQEVGYIKIFHFQQNTASELKKAIEDLSSQGAVSFVIDVRGCKEGTLENVLPAIDLMVSAGGEVENNNMVKINYKNEVKNSQTYPSDPDSMISFITGRVAVLIDKQTSGIAELFAYDLHAYNLDKVILVGEKTLGNNSVQQAFPISTVGGAALLTIGSMTPYNAKDDTVLAKGVEPSKKEYEIKDSQLQLATAIYALTKSVDPTVG